MTRKNIIKQNNARIRSDEKHAQILLKVDLEVNTIAKAKQILDECGIDILRVKNISPNRVLFKLDVTDMRPAVLKLIENGFLEIQGYNASSYVVQS